MIGTSLALALGIGGAAAAAAGGIASAVGQENKRATQDNLLQDFRNSTGAFSKSESETLGGQQMLQGQKGFQSALTNEFAAGSGAQLDFANMLKQYAQGGNLPTQQDITRTQALANSLYNPQQIALRQQFQEQLTSANRQAALSGRGINDPVLRAKLATEQSRQNAMLQAQQGAYATQLAMAQPGERLGYMGQRAQTMVQRGTNALSAQQSLYSLGAQAQQQGFSQRQSDFQTQFNALSGIKSTGEIIGGAMESVGAGLTNIGSMGMQGAQFKQQADFQKQLLGFMGGSSPLPAASSAGKYSLGSNLSFGTPSPLNLPTSATSASPTGINWGANTTQRPLVLSPNFNGPWMAN